MEECSLKLEDTRPEYNCKFCSEDLKNCIQCHGNKISSWRYLNDGDHCHFECYVQECVRKELDKLK